MKTPINKDNLDQLFNKAKADKEGLDAFEKDAMEGFDMLGSEQEAADLKAALDTRIQKELFQKEEERNPKIYWFAAAGLVLVIGLSVLFVVNNNESLSNTHDVAVVNTVKESEENVLPDTKKVELKEENVAPPTEAVTTTDEESATKKSQGNTKAGLMDGQDFAGEKDVAAAKVVKDEKEAKPRMVVAASTKGPVDIKPFEKEQSERKKEEVADEIVATGSGTNSKTNANPAKLDDLSKGYKDQQSEAYKSVSNKTPDQKLKLAETESTPKNDVSLGNPKEKAKKEDRNDDNDAEKNLNQPVVAYDKNNNTSSVNRDEKASGKKAKRANNKQSAAGMVTQNEDYTPGSPNTTTTKDAVVLETTVANTAAAEAQIENKANCFYTGGEMAITNDLREKLKGKDIDQKFDATVFITEKKVVEKVEYINSYDLTSKQKEDITKILKTLTKFNFLVCPTTKSSVPYKIIYRP